MCKGHVTLCERPNQHLLSVQQLYNQEAAKIKEKEKPSSLLFRLLFLTVESGAVILYSVVSLGVSGGFPERVLNTNTGPTHISPLIK